MSDAKVIAALSDQIAVTRQRATEAERIADDLRSESNARSRLVVELTEQVEHYKHRAAQMSTAADQWRSRYTRVDEPRVLAVLKAATERNATIARLALECSTLSSQICRVSAEAKSDRANAEQLAAYLAKSAERARLNMNIANEAMRVGLEMCEELMSRVESAESSRNQMLRMMETDLGHKDAQIDHFEKLAKEAIGLKMTLNSMMGERDEALKLVQIAQNEIVALSNETDCLRADLERARANIERWEDKEIRRAVCCSDSWDLIEAATIFEFGNFTAEKGGTKTWAVIDHARGGECYVAVDLPLDEAAAMAKTRNKKRTESEHQ